MIEMGPNTLEKKKTARKLWCTAPRGRTEESFGAQHRGGRREALRQESCEFEATLARSCLRENKLVTVILHPSTQAAGAGEGQQIKPDVKI